MALPEGAHYVRGSKRKQVRLADGRVVERSEAENLSARTLGIPSVTNAYQLKKWNRFRRSPEAQQAVESYRREGSKDRANAARLRASGDSRAAGDEQIERLVVEMKRQKVEAGGWDKTPGGALSQYLTAVGRRQPGADYAVGETPNAS